MTVLTAKTFQMSDQRRFAQASGDRNPIHVDEIAARRTQAGAPVVHGIHLLLWALDAFATMHPDSPLPFSVRAQFKRLVYVNEPASVAAEQISASATRLTVMAEGTPRSEFLLEFGSGITDIPDWADGPLEMLSLEPEPRNVSLEQLRGLCGRLPLQMTTEDSIAAFPAATKWLGAEFLRGLAATTHLVGMVCPGLHSLYNELSVKRCREAEQAHESLAFRVTKVDQRFSCIHEEVTGSGFTGKITTFMRASPVTQPSMSSLAAAVRPNEFAGSHVLIVGGSRGLGELVAKLIALGGGRVLITWQSGQDDAMRVAQEIRSSGGHCTAFHYDARQPAAAQLGALTEAPTHAYYFATPVIFRSRAELYSARRLSEFLKIYVDGFWELTQALRARRANISLFYPSTVFVTERPPGMTEYAMAKAAGESLCADINAQLAPTRVTVKRLPRLPTDQTGSLSPVKLDDPLAVMLSVVREAQMGPQSS